MRFVFTKTISVYRLTDASDKESYSLDGTIKGYLTPISAEDAMLTEGNPAQTYKLITDYSSDIQRGDKLTYDGADYIVSGIQRHDFGATRRTEAICQQFNS
jgi:hypothetical protein